MVQKTEKRLPFNCSASALGQAVTKVVATGGEYHLVSYLTSPVAKGTYNDYVVFVTDDAPEPDHYRWSFQCLYKKITYVSNELTGEGIFQFQIPLDAERLEVKVEICDLVGKVIETLVMEHDIIESLEIIKSLMGEGKPSVTYVSSLVGAGHPDTTIEILDNFRLYIEEAAFSEAERLVAGAEGIPPAFLASIAYKEAYQRPYRFSWERPYLAMEAVRSYELEKTREEINNPGNLIILNYHLNNTLGVCQISLTTAAMHLGLITFRELTAKGREAVIASIKSDYDKNVKDTDEEVDLFNLLRFPKTNILVCAKILNSLKNRSKRWPELKMNNFILDENAFKIIATEYNKGATETPRDNAGPNDYSLKVLKFSKSHLIQNFFSHSINSYMLDKTISLKKGDQDRLAGVVLDNATGVVCKNYITELQTDLFNLGFLDSKYINGSFGEETESAVMAFKTAARAATRINRYTLKGQSISDVFTGTVTGIVDAATADEIRKWIRSGWIGVSPYGNYILKLGDSDATKTFGGVKRVSTVGRFVSELQRDLLRLGYWVSLPNLTNHATRIDGSFTDTCKGSVYLFQREHGFPTTGEVDLTTGSKIKELLAALTDGKKYRRPGKENNTYKHCTSPAGTKEEDKKYINYNFTLYQLTPSDDYYFRNAEVYLKDNYMDSAWGQIEMIEMLEKAAAEWVKARNECFCIVDLSHDDGREINFQVKKADGTYETKSHHQMGAKVDINSRSYCKIDSPYFDRFKATELANTFISNGAARILFNCAYVFDNAVRKDGKRMVFPLISHHHHFHIDTFLLPPRETTGTVSASSMALLCDKCNKKARIVQKQVNGQTVNVDDPEQIESEWNMFKANMPIEEVIDITDINAYVREHSVNICFYEKRAGLRTASDNL